MTSTSRNYRALCTSSPDCRRTDCSIKRLGPVAARRFEHTGHVSSRHTGHIIVTSRRQMRKRLVPCHALPTPPSSRILPACPSRPLSPLGRFERGAVRVRSGARVPRLILGAVVFAAYQASVPRLYAAKRPPRLLLHPHLAPAAAMTSRGALFEAFRVALDCEPLARVGREEAAASRAGPGAGATAAARASGGLLAGGSLGGRY